MVSFSPRTIFLMIRATSQIGEAFNDAGKKVDNLKEKQENLAKTAQHLLFAGAAMVAFGAMVTGAMLSTLSSTLRGQRVLDDFGKAVERIKQSFSETIMNNFGEQIKGVLKTLTDFSNNKEQMEMIVNIALTFGPGLIAGGAALILSAVILGITGMLSGALSALAFTSAAGAVAAGGGAVVIGLISVALGVAVGLYLRKMFWKDDYQSKIDEFLADPKYNSGFNVVPKPGEFVGPVLPGNESTSKFGPNASVGTTTFNQNNYFSDIKTKSETEEMPNLFDLQFKNGILNTQTIVPEGNK